MVDGIDSLPAKVTTPVPVEWLSLDRENPRLVSEENIPDEAIIAQLYRGEELSELLQSIAANGYLDIEPLVVLKEKQKNSLTVLEGNRRLAAIRLFREADLVDKVAKQERLRITLPEISKKERETLEQVPVYRVETRDEANSFIGFKHINGAAKWDSYAKGQFAAKWYRSGNIELSEIANRIGDSHNTVKRMMNAIYVLEQAEKTGVFHLSNRFNLKFSFSHLYAALPRTPYMEFLGLGASWGTFEPKENPVPKSHIKELGEVLKWIYGSKEDDVEPVIYSQNPDVKRLGEVLLNQEGLNILRTGGSLDEAHVSTESASEKFVEGLLRARKNIREVSNNLRGFDRKDRSLIDIALDIVVTSQAVLDHMLKKSDSARRRDKSASGE